MTTPKTKKTHKQRFEHEIRDARNAEMGMAIENSEAMGYELVSVVPSPVEPNSFVLFFKRPV
jgi:hypothetical protein